jgi:hypothetical protein
VAFLPAETFHFAHRHSFDPDLGEPILHRFHLKWFDDGLDFFHALILGLVTQSASGRSLAGDGERRHLRFNHFADQVREGLAWFPAECAPDFFARTHQLERLSRTLEGRVMF